MKLSKHSIAQLAIAAAIFALAPNAKAGDIDIYAEINDTRPGNIAVTPDNRVIITQQPLDAPTFRVMEVKPDGTKVPFPTVDWSDGPDVGDVGIASTIGIKSDSNGVVWILDMGGKNSPPKLVAWDTKANKLHRVIEIPADVTVPISFLQDFALDEKRGKVYIADMTFTKAAHETKPAFIVIDIPTGKARRVLERDSRLMPVERDVVINGRLMGFKDDDGNPKPWHLALNAISIDPAFDHVYFATINGEDIFRIPATALADDSLDRDAVASRIETYGKKGPNDGFIVDGKGRVFSGDTEKNAVTVSTSGDIKVVASNRTLLHWPDGFAFAPDGTLYVVANQLNTNPALNLGVDGSDKRYFIVTIKPE